MDINKEIELLVNKSVKELIDKQKNKLENYTLNIIEKTNWEDIILQATGKILDDFIVIDNKIKLKHYQYKNILKLIQIKHNILLFGPAGSGKNYVVKQIASALKLPFRFTNAVLDQFQLKGFNDINGKYVPTSFYDTWVNGGIFYLDELDASDPEAVIFLNAALANGYAEFPHEVKPIFKHKDFIFVAGTNTNGFELDHKYKRQLLDGATLDRFAFIKFDYDLKLEKAILKSFSKNQSDIVKIYLAFTSKILNSIRILNELKEYDVIVSTRAFTLIYEFIINQKESWFQTNYETVLEHFFDIMLSQYIFKGRKIEESTIKNEIESFDQYNKELKDLFTLLKSTTSTLDKDGANDLEELVLNEDGSNWIKDDDALDLDDEIELDDE